MHSETIKNLGEKELIKRLSKYLPEKQTSDDCAFLKGKFNNLLINTDLMVESTHFAEGTINAKDLGWKATVTNFSDLFSSGCDEILGLNIGLVLNPNTKWDWVNNVYQGICQALDQFGGKIFGGDCSRGEKNVIAITAFGTQGEIKLRRYACKPGDILLTTGIHGLSKLGYLLKTNQLDAKKLKLTNSLKNDAIKSFCRPEPKQNALQTIIETKNCKKNIAVGCTDSSDGLFQAVLDLATESECKAIIDYKKLPKNEHWPSGLQWDNYYLFGGEDYELICSLPRKWANQVLNKNSDFFEIGHIEKGNPDIILKNYDKNNLLNNRPYSHF